MDILFWGLLILFAIFFGLVTHRGFQRWRDHVTASNREGTQSNISGVDPYINALRRGDPEELAKAPLPEHFSEELLLQALLRIQNQPSLYDLFLERLTQQFTIGQYERLVSTWTRYCQSLGEGTASQNVFLRQLSERLTIHLETQKIAASLEADIDNENLRGSRARHERWQLWEPPQQQKQQEQKHDTFESLQKEMDKLRQWRRREHKKAKDEQERQVVDQQFEAFRRELEMRLQRLRPPRV